jgi:hypothetical protein
MMFFLNRKERGDVAGKDLVFLVFKGVLHPVVGWMNGRWFLSRREGKRCLCHGGFLAGRAVGFSDIAFERGGFEVLYSIDMLKG